MILSVSLWWTRLKFTQELEKQEEQRKTEQKNKPGFDGRWYTDINEKDKSTKTKDEKGDGDDEAAWEKEKKEFWEEPTSYTPESRKQVCRIFPMIDNHLFYGSFLIKEKPFPEWIWRGTIWGTNSYPLPI